MSPLDYRLEQFPSLNWKDSERTKEIVNLIRNTTEAAIPDHLLGLLYELARGLHHDFSSTDGFVVEFGSYKGGSASALALGLRDADGKRNPVLAVDSYGWPYPGLKPGEVPNENGFPHSEHYQIARSTYWKLNIAWEYVCQVITRTNDMFFKIWANPIRLIFIDSSHLYDLTCQEISGALKYMVKDSWMVFDDYENTVWGEGVIPAVNEFLDNEKIWKKEVFRSGNGCILVHIKDKVRKHIS